MAQIDTQLTVSVTVGESPRLVTVTVAGELDHFTAPELEQAARPWLRPGTSSLHIDLSDLRFLDSGGLSGLIRTWQRAQRHGIPVSLVVRPQLVASIVDVNGLKRLMHVTVAPG